MAVTFKSRPEDTRIRPLRGEVGIASQVEGRAYAKALSGGKSSVPLGN